MAWINGQYVESTGEQPVRIANIQRQPTEDQLVDPTIELTPPVVKKGGVRKQPDQKR